MRDVPAAVGPRLVRAAVPTVASALLVASMAVSMAVAPVQPAHATIVDEGLVVLGPDGQLAIGRDGFGRRTVTGQADGPYEAVGVGVASGGAGALVLAAGARFETTGRLSLGGEGGALLDVSGGSELVTGSARVVDFESLEFPVTPPVQLRVDGAGSAWRNAGLLELGRRAVLADVDLVLSGGALLETHGVEGWARNVGDSGTDVVVEGAGTRWSNTGEWRLTGPVTFTLRDGATASDAGVTFVDSFERGRATVEGAGSLWQTGALRLVSRDDALQVRAGGRVESSSAFLTSQTSVRALVTGIGSTWAVDGPLSVLANDAGGNAQVTVEAGARVEARGTTVGGGGSGLGWIAVTGVGSRFENAGELHVAGRRGVRAWLDVMAGGAIDTESFRVACVDEGFAPFGGCQVRVAGAGSLLDVANDAQLSGTLVDPALLTTATLSDGGHLAVGGVLTVGEGATLALDAGTVAATQLALAGGALSGAGTVAAPVTNAGLLSPGGAGGAGIGRIAIDGSLTQQGDGVLVITLGGTEAGVTHDLVAVLGTSVLGGRLQVSLADGYFPLLGDEFLVLTAASVSGAFAHFEGLELRPGRALRVDVLADGLRLVTVPEPGTAVLLGAGLALCGAVGRRRSRLTHPG